MSASFLGLSTIGSPAETDPYLPFPAALETGVLTDPETMAMPLHRSLGVDIANGSIPNPKGAGIIDLRDGLVVALDHASIEYTGRDLYIFPAAKDAVNRDGIIQEEGAIIMAGLDERIKLVAVTVDTEKNPWLTQRLNRDGRRLGKIATFSLGMDAPGYEIYDIDGQSGIIKARPSSSIFAF